ncbi:MAG: ABC-2 transporter permease [Epulopiscium sp.]|nr:ABC-2 transporter permease [Candidatus Epulonipiscium sp.]
MKGLIIKDLLNLRKYSRSVLSIILFYILFAYAVNDRSFIGGMIVLLFTMMAITSFSYDDLAKWDRYALSMPVSRKNMVLSKYTLSILLSTTGTIISILVGLVFMTIKDKINVLELLITSYIFLAISLLFISILLPLIYKFGVEKTRILMMVVVSIPTAAVLLFNHFGFPLPTEAQFMFSLKISPLLVILCLFISNFISCRIYENLEI